MGSLATDEIEAFLRRLGDRYPPTLSFGRQRPHPG